MRASKQRRYVSNGPRIHTYFVEDLSSRAGQFSVFCSNNGYSYTGRLRWPEMSWRLHSIGPIINLHS